MLSSLLKLTSIVCCVIVALSFAAFVSDQAGHSSKKTVATIAAEDNTQAAAASAQDVNVANPSPSVERLREKQHSSLREKLDDGNDILTSPFSSVAGSGSVWAQRIVGGLLALLVFGIGLGFLGRLAALRGI